MTKKILRVEFQIESTAGSRTDRILADHFEQDAELPTVSRSQIQRLLSDQKILKNGSILEKKDSLKMGDHVEVILETHDELDIQPEDLPLDILYQDTDLAVVIKPVGMVTHPSVTSRAHTLVHALLYHLKELSGVGGVLRPGIVHRLDKDTTGIMVVSKNDFTHQHLSEQFSKHTIIRKYRAWTYGFFPHQLPFTFEAQIGRSPSDRKKMAIDGSASRHSKSIFTREKCFSIPGKKPFASQVLAELKTGRTHQVRVHLTHLGHSLFGDTTYGTPSSSATKWTAVPKDVQAEISKLQGQALQAFYLEFAHPRSNEKMIFSQEISPFFNPLVDSLSKFEEL